ncbi:MAG: helix-turn-helix transcriptional regulator [Nocardioides sp.]|uniref:helix-turn-helix transcriptional regulator n=1 Tax=Nocardioides sp. TaxID=35761 RepID=UPI003266DC19
MRLRRPELLADYMKANDFTQARLARYAGCSRQFIHLLLKGERSTCTVEVGRRIEEAVRVLPGTLFEPSMSPDARQSVKSDGTAA